MLVLLAWFASCIQLPAELRNENRRSTSYAGLSEITQSVDPQIVSHLRVSQPITDFLSRYSAGPINIVFCSFENFFKTPVVVSGYMEPEWNEMPVFTTRQDEEAMNKTNNGMYFTMRLCNFYNCKNTDINVGGGALHCTSATRIYSCTFTQCSVTQGNGGAICAEFTEPGDRLLINSCSFMSCSSKRNGGSIACSNCRLEIFRTEFLISTAGWQGGAFWYEQGSNIDILYILSCMFYECTVENPDVDAHVFYASMNINRPRHPIVKLDFCRFSKPLPENITAGEFDGAGMWQISPINDFLEMYRNRYATGIEAVRVTPTYTFTAIATATPMASATPNATESQTPLPTETCTPSPTESCSLPPTFTFTPSAIFTGVSGDIGTESASLVPSSSPIQSTSIPEQTSPPATRSQSLSFSRSPHATPTGSASASVSASPMATCTPSASDIPAISWGGLSLGLLIFGLVILLIGIIANVILCAMCCRPSEILARQYV